MATSESQEPERGSISRRDFFVFLAALGASSAAFSSSSIAQKEDALPFTEEDIQAAEKLFDLHFTDEERKMMMRTLLRRLESYKEMHTISIDNSVPPAFIFSPLLPGMNVKPEKNACKPTRPRLTRPDTEEELAFLPVTRLAHLIRTRQISSVELTRLYLERLKKYDPLLHCVISLTEERALKQAEKADHEIRVGDYRGPLHGIPWGAKDLLAVKGYKTTWGAMPFKDQTLDLDATVVQRLDAAGAVLVGKMTLGALAMGDVWFGGKTRNPWNPEQGSSGSSAGSAAATAAGLVGFAIGTETLGSIVSPSTRCGTTGLRPTFGRVSRFGAMALSWTMDKIGPLCRSVEDCALVFNAIYGPDNKDPMVFDYPFYWNPRRKIKGMRIGYSKEVFEEDHPTKEFDLKTLNVLENLGFELVPIQFPEMPYRALRVILNAEAAAAFDEITRNRQIDTMVRQDRGAWPNSFRSSRFIPAVEYLQASRLRTLLMQKTYEMMKDVDVLVSPPYGGPILLLTNLTGHPAVVMPNGFTDQNTPVSITFIGHLFKESDLLAVAKAYQDATGFHLKHPTLKA